MIRRARCLVLAASTLALASCSAGSGPQSSPPPAAAEVDLTGDWTFSANARRDEGSDRVRGQLRLDQKGDSVRGPFETEATVGGELNGFVAGRELELTLKQWAPCAGSFSGSAKVSSDGLRMSGSYSGTDCEGSVEADFQARRSLR